MSYFLEPDDIFVSPQPAVISTVLGSCIAVCLYDAKGRVGGMNHFQFPATRRQDQATARYGNVALPYLIRMILERGSKKNDLEAQIFGGAHNREISPEDVGRENLTIARRLLAREGIRIVSEDVGGEKGRKIVFNTRDKEIAVLKVDQLRKGDWYPFYDCNLFPH